MKGYYKPALLAGALATALGVQQAQAQLPEAGALGYYHDVARFSRNMLYGSARTNALAGVQTALGADPSALLGNPAGLGVYRRSEVSGSPSIWFGNAESSMAGGPLNDDFKPQFNISNLSLIFADMRDPLTSSDWRGSTFGIGLSTTANFNQRYSYNGFKATGQKNSIIDEMYDEAQNMNFFSQGFDGMKPGQALVLQGYNTFLLDSSINDPTKWAVVAPLSDIAYRGTLTTSGSINQLDLGWGGNYKDQLFIGAGLGLSFLRYREQLDYTETLLNVQPNEGAWQRGYEAGTVTYRRDLSVRGTGINGRLGLIYKPADVVRFGLSYQTPTLWGMTDQAASSHVLVNFPNLNYPGYGVVGARDWKITNDSRAGYTMVTPHRLTAGIAGFIGEYGFISADAEYLTFSGARLTSSDFDIMPDRRSIKQVYDNVLNLRAAGELRLGVVRLRAGYAFLPSPYKEGAGTRLQAQTADITQISGGAGLRFDSWFIDLGVINTSSENRFDLHTYSPVVNNKLSSTMAVVTVGGTF